MLDASHEHDEIDDPADALRVTARPFEVELLDVLARSEVPMVDILELSQAGRFWLPVQEAA